MGKFVIKETKTGVKFDLKAGNGEVILTSEVYKSERSCMKGVESVKRNAPIAPVEDQTAEGYAKEKRRNRIYKPGTCYKYCKNIHSPEYINPLKKICRIYIPADLRSAIHYPLWQYLDNEMEGRK